MKKEDVGRRLNKEWGVVAEHALYSKTGKTYDHLRRFPGALFDDDGYVVFHTKQEYANREKSGHLHIRKKVSVPSGIRQIPNYKSRPKTDVRKILFARIGHMIGYQGPRPPEDPKPLGGGSYNKNYIGHEAFNFQNNNGKLYGYFQPYLKKGAEIQNSRISLERIDPTVDSIDELKNVLVIFISKRPKHGGQVIVGWYNHATVYRNYRKPPQGTGRARKGFNFNIICKPDNAVLLPTSVRPALFSKDGPKSGRPGQANAFYLYDKDGRRDTSLGKFKWISQALTFVDTFERENVLNDPTAEALSDIEATYEKAMGSATGQGIRITSEARKAIEDHSMTRAEKYFEDHYKVENCCKTKPFDLLCVHKKTGQELRVEVKGTQTKGASVLLTYGEVNSARTNRSALYILHSVCISGRGKKTKASGGKEHVVNPWKLENKDLKEITYSYAVHK